MSGSFIGGVIGAIAGSFIPGVGPQIGWLIGSTLGASLDSMPDQQGPRLSDLLPQASEYGRPIPIIYGTVGLGGNVIWASPLIEVSTTTDQGGKGGPSQSTTTFSYFANFAVALCEGERDVGRIWAGPEKRLIYDGVTLEGGGSIRIYTGTETQLPDPLIESYLGVGNVPAYRGVTYVVFENYPVANDGNRIPFITAEVGTASATGTVSRVPVYLGESAPIAHFSAGTALVDPSTRLIWSLHHQQFASAINVYVNSDVTMTQVAHLTAPGTLLTPADMTYIPFASVSNPQVAINMIAFGMPAMPNIVMVAAESYGPFTDEFALFNADTQQYLGTITGVYHGTASIMAACDNPVQRHLLVARYGGRVNIDPHDGTGTTATLVGLLSEPGANGFYIGEVFGDLGTCWVDQMFVAGPYIAFVVYGSYSVIVLRSVTDYSFVGRYTVPYTAGANGHVVYDDVRNRFVIFHGISFDYSAMTYSILDVTTGVVTAHTVGTGLQVDTAPPPSGTGFPVIFRNGKYIFGATNAGSTNGTTLVIVDPDSLVAEHVYTYEVDASTNFKMCIPLLAPVGNKPYLFSFDDFHVKRLYFKPSSLGGVPLSDVVADLSSRAGLSSGQYDVAALTDIVDGYAVARPTAVRGAIDALRPAYYFDGVESSSLVKYVKRGGAISVVIPDDDLAAHEPGQTAPDALLTTRQMDVELPRTLNVNYLLAATNYSGATKLSKRLVGSSGAEQTMDMPLVLSDTKAQQIADVNLHLAWVQRLTYGFSLPKKYAYLEPTDIVVVKGHTMLLRKITATPSGLLQCEAVADDSNYYVPNVVVTETPTSTQTVFVPGATRLELM